MFETATPDWFFQYYYLQCIDIFHSLPTEIHSPAWNATCSVVRLGICKLTQKELCYELSHLLSSLLCCCYCCCCCCFFAIVPLTCQTLVLPDDVILQF